MNFGMNISFGDGGGFGQQNHPFPQQQQMGGFNQMSMFGAGGMQQHQQQQYNHYSQQGYTHPYGQPPPPSQHYGNYGQQLHQNAFQSNALVAFGINSQNDFQMLYERYKSRTLNGIQGEELQRILNEDPNIRNFYQTQSGPIKWNLELCKILIAMLDRNKDGIMQLPELHELLQCLTFWWKTFTHYDSDRSGYIEAHELGNIIKNSFSYSLSQKALEVILKRYSRAMDDRRCLVAFDDFVAMSVRLRAYTEAFRARDRARHGNQEVGTYEFSYDDFLQCVLCL